MEIIQIYNFKNQRINYHVFHIRLVNTPPQVVE